MNKTAKTAARKTVNVLMLVILAFLTTLPIFWCIITSLKTPQDISAYPPKIFNFTVTWNNYKHGEWPAVCKIYPQNQRSVCQRRQSVWQGRRRIFARECGYLQAGC